MNTTNLLQSLGLSKTEAQLYLASLELGPASAIQLGQKLSFTRQLMYNLLPHLIEQGFMKKLTIGKRHFFQAVGPEVLQDKADLLAQEIKATIPLLRQQQAQNSTLPAITVYDNPLSMREWYRFFMKSVKNGEEKLVYSTEEGWFGLDPEFNQRFADFQTKKGTRNRIIAPDTEAARQVATSIASPTHQYRFASEGWGGHSAKWIWRDQIVHLTIRGKATSLIVLESAELAAIERFAFNRVWESLDSN